MPGAAVTPDDVRAFTAPTEGYLCPLAANTFGVEFLRFDIKDYESGKSVYQSPSDQVGEDQILDPSEYEDLVRSVKYAFPGEFLSFKTVRTSLEFKVGPQPLGNFRMIELHYFKGKLVRTYDFTFGFCIPNSTNTWEAIYDVPAHSASEVKEYMDSPYEHKSDSFYFVDDKLIMHNKAQYMYI